jgi:hypothetical protein
MSHDQVLFLLLLLLDDPPLRPVQARGPMEIQRLRRTST